MNKYFPKALLFHSFFSLAFIVNIELLNAQTGIQGAQSQKIRWMSAGVLRSWFNNFGTEGVFSRRDRTTYVYRIKSTDCAGLMIIPLFMGR